VPFAPTESEDLVEDLHDIVVRAAPTNKRTPTERI